MYSISESKIFLSMTGHVPLTLLHQQAKYNTPLPFLNNIF